MAYCPRGKEQIAFKALALPGEFHGAKGGRKDNDRDQCEQRLPNER
jgi:hypothetical protein